MPNKLPIDLPAATSGRKIVHSVNIDDTTDTPQGTSQKIQVASENTIEFTSDFIQFLGEKGVPTLQGWSSTGTGTPDIVAEVKDGILQDVVRFNDNDGNIYTSEIALTASDWQKISDNGADFVGNIRMDTFIGENGGFIGLQVDAVDSPDASPNDRRYGISFSKSPVDNTLRVTNNDGGATDDVLDAVFDEYNEIRLSIPPAFADAVLRVNGNVIATNIPLRINGGGTGTKCIISSGSSGGALRVFYASDFGVNIYEEPATKLITNSDVASFDKLTIIVPQGARDYTINVDPGVQGRRIGDLTNIFAQNVDGTITLTDLSSPPIVTVNNLSSVTIPVPEVTNFSLINTIEDANTYQLETRHETALIPQSISLFGHVVPGEVIVDFPGTVLTWQLLDQVGPRNAVITSLGVFFGRKGFSYEIETLVDCVNGNDINGDVTFNFQIDDNEAMTTPTTTDFALKNLTTFAGGSDQEVTMVNFNVATLTEDTYFRIVAENSDTGLLLTVRRAKLKVKAFRLQM